MQEVKASKDVKNYGKQKIGRASVGKECTGQDEECKIVVISKDTGFDHIIEFWKAEKNVKISRNEKISGKQAQTRKQVKKQTGKEKDRQITEQTDQKTEKQLNEQSEKQSAKQSENQNTKKPKQKIIDMKAGTKKLQQELVLVLDKAGMPKEVVNTFLQLWRKMQKTKTESSRFTDLSFPNTDRQKD